jgi:hypothetical protein
MLTALLDRSDAFQAALDEALASHNWVAAPGARLGLAGTAAILSLEHGMALRMCYAAGFPQSASALIRLQFEALVRGVWLRYVAPDEVLDTAETGLSVDSDAAAKKWPMAPVMLQALITGAPPGLVVPLRQFQAVAWQPLNSFVHAGIHPLERQTQGFPVVLAQQNLRSSNGLVHLAYRLIADLSGSAEAMAHLTGLWADYQDCLPPVLG